MRIVLDIETRRFSKKFQSAKKHDDRVRHAPRPYLACIYIVEKKKFQFFTERTLKKLIPPLCRATEVITFHGERFDFHVLEKWGGLVADNEFLSKSIDLCRVNRDRPFLFLNKPWVKGGNLDRIAKLNLGIPRKTTGSLKSKCRQHVRLTYQLYELFKKGTALHVVRPERNLPTVCPECGAKSEIIPFQPSYAGMTEGQIFDYELGQQFGMQGYARCTRGKCRHVFVWGI